MARYEDGSFDVYNLTKTNGETVPVLGYDYAMAYQEFAENRGISKDKAWGNSQLIDEFNQLYPQFAKDYAHEKANFYDSEEVAEETDEGTIVEDDIEVGRIQDEVNELDERLHSDSPDEEEKEGIRERLIELRNILIAKGESYYV